MRQWTVVRHVTIAIRVITAYGIGRLRHGRLVKYYRYLSLEINDNNVAGERLVKLVSYRHPRLALITTRE